MFSFSVYIPTVPGNWTHALTVASDISLFKAAETQFFTSTHTEVCVCLSSQDTGANSILQDIARARENIQKSLAGVSRAKTLPLLFELCNLALF